MWIKIGIPVIAALALGFGAATVLLLNPKEELASPIHQPAATTFKGPTVAGLGIVEPRSECISIGSPLSGIVGVVNVVAGQKVNKGQPLFALDDRELRAELNLRQRTLDLERARLDRVQSEPRPEDLPPARHRVAAAKVNFEQSQDQCDRSEKLIARKAISAEDAQIRRFAVRVAEAELAKAEAELTRIEAGAWDRDIAVSKQNVTLAQANVDRVKVDLERLTVKSPMDGIVLKVNIRPGEFVSAEATVEPLISLGDRGPLRVRVQVDEEDALRVAPDQAAEGYVRGRVRERLSLNFIRIEPGLQPKKSLSGGTTERIDTRVLIVLYEIEPSPNSIYVGQQIDVFIAPSTNRRSR